MCFFNLSKFFFRIIASGVRRLSRSFYGGSGENLGHSHRRTGSLGPGNFAELSGGNGNHGSLRQLPTGQHSQATPHPLAGKIVFLNYTTFLTHNR